MAEVYFSWCCFSIVSCCTAGATFSWTVVSCCPDLDMKSLTAALADSIVVICGR
uniref:Uncharacterized protein n=1 Tax=Phakopsora pachyrhizi TaxID=170000 RepID=A0A0S1MIG1_PHAPC